MQPQKGSVTMKNNIPEYDLTNRLAGYVYGALLICIAAAAAAKFISLII